MNLDGFADERETFQPSELDIVTFKAVGGISLIPFDPVCWDRERNLDNYSSQHYNSTNRCLKSRH